MAGEFKQILNDTVTFFKDAVEADKFVLKPNVEKSWWLNISKVKVVATPRALVTWKGMQRRKQSRDKPVYVFSQSTYILARVDGPKPDRIDRVEQLIELTDQMESLIFDREEGVFARGLMEGLTFSADTVIRDPLSIDQMHSSVFQAEIMVAYMKHR